MRELGGVFGIAVAVAVFAGAGGYASASAFSRRLRPGRGRRRGLFFVGALVGLALPGVRRAIPIPEPAQ